MIAWGLQKELRLPKPMAVDVFASGLPEAYVAKDVSEGYEFVDPGKGKPIPVLVLSAWSPWRTARWRRPCVLSSRPS